MALRPRVTHELPGRVRLHLPALKHIPANMRMWVQEAAQVFARHEAIEDIETNPVTGNVLIHYDADKIEGQEVVAYFNRFVRFSVDNLTVLRDLPPSDRGAYIRRVLEEQPWAPGDGH